MSLYIYNHLIISCIYYVCTYIEIDSDIDSGLYILISGYSWTNHQERYGSTPFHTHHMAPKPLEGTIPPESQVQCLHFMKFTAATCTFFNELLTKRIHYDSFHCCWECSQNKNGRTCFDAGVKSTCI